MAYERPTLSEKVAQTEADINGRLPGADSRLRRSVLWVLARVWAAGFYLLYGYLDWVIKQLFVSTCSEDFLPVHGAIWNVTRKPATQSAGTIQVTGDIGELIEAGTKLQRTDGFVFQVDEDTVLTSSPQAITVTSVGFADKTVTVATTQLRFVSPVAGVNSVAVVSAPGLLGGADQEGAEAWRQRILARIRKRGQSGSLSDYEQWALEVAGVTRAWAYPGWMGPGRVGLTFVFDGRGDIIPTEGDVENMVTYIFARRPVTANIDVFAPLTNSIAFSIDLTPDTPEVRAAVTAALDDLLAREGEPGGGIKISRVREAVSLAEGETDNVVSIPAGNVAGVVGRIPRRGAITWL